MANLRQAEQLWWNIALILALMFAATLVAWMLDGRLIDRESVWMKPLKFEASLAVHFATLAVACNAIGGQSRWSTALLVIAAASIAATAFEMIYIIVQAARQQASHFNLSTPFHGAMYVLMAIGAVVITFAAGAVGAAVWFDPKEGAGPALRIGLALGLLGGTILTLVTAFRMGGALNHHAGVELPGGLRMPITGWSLSVGDRRVPHFLATHMMQVVPLAGFALDRIVRPSVATILVVGIALIWTATTLVAFAQSNKGLPLTKWPWP